jgi:hypothetical protein
VQRPARTDRQVAAFTVRASWTASCRRRDDIEELTNGLSRKIWQKLTLLDQMVGPARA